MKLINRSGDEISIADAIRGSIDTGDYALNDLINIVSKLVEILHTNHKLTNDQLKSMLNSYRYTMEE